MKKLLQLCSVLMLGLLFLAGNAQAQDIWVDAAANPLNALCTFAAPCNELTKAMGVVAPGQTIQITGTTVEPGVVAITVPNIIIQGAEADPTSINFAGVTRNTGAAAQTVLNVTSDDVTIRNLWVRFTVNAVYDELRVMRTNAANTVFDNLTIGDVTVANAIRTHVNFGPLSSNAQLTNSRLIGPISRSSVNINGGGGHLVSNNLFQYTHTGFSSAGDLVANPMGASIFIGRGQVTSAIVEFNRIAPTIVDGALNDGPNTGIYIEGGWSLAAPDDILVSHNTIEMDGSASTRDVHGIYFDIDTVTLPNGPNANNNAITSITNGHIAVRDNVITGAVDSTPGDGSSFGLYVPIAFGPTFASYNIFFGNEDDSNNAIDVTTGPGNGNNISEDVSGAAADPLLDGTDEFGYLVGSPALNSSSSAPNVLSGNRGFNQELNSNPPTVTPPAIVGSGVSAPVIRANETTNISWTFGDLDSPADDAQTDALVEVFDNVAVTPGDLVFSTNTGAVEFYDGVIPNTRDALPTLAAGTQYWVRVTVYDHLGLETQSTVTSFMTAVNAAPTASNFTVDGLGPNPAVNNVNPEFSFTYNDLDGDPMTDIVIDVFRITANCGANCAPLILPPNPGSEPDGPNPGLLVTSTTLPMVANDGDVVTFNYYDLVPIQEQLIANETYVYRLRVVHAGPNQSPIYNNYTAPNNGVMTFTTVPSSNPSVTDLMVQANAVPLFKDNSVTPRVVLGTAVAEPNLRWTYNGFDTMKSYELRIVRNPGVGTNPQGELTGANLVHYTGILPASDPNLNEYLPKQYEWDYQGAPIPITNNQTHFAQVRVYNQLNVASDWEQIDFTRNAAPSATDFLADGDGMVPVPVLFTDDITPTITWTYTDADLAKSPGDEGQSAFHIQIFDNIGFVGAPIVDTGKTASALGTYEVTPDLTLLYNAVYFVRIRVWDGLDVPNHASNWISAGAFRTPVNAPPVLTDILLDGAADGSPAVNYTLNPTPQFDWTFTDPEGRDQFQYSATINDVTNTLSYSFAAPVAGNAAMYVVVPGDFVGFPGFIPGNDYEFELTVWDATSDGSGNPALGTSDTESYPFTFVTLPSAPALAVTPLRVDGEVNSTTPSFLVTPSDADGEDAQSLDLQLQSLPGNVNLYNSNIAGPFTDGVQTTVTFATLAIGNLVPNNSYRWRSRTVDIHGNGDWSGWETFVVNPIPSAPTAVVIEVNPGDNQMNLPNGPTFTVSWTNNDFGFDAVEYQAALFDGANAVLIQNFGMNPVGGVNTGSFTPAVPLTPGTTYTLRLRVGDDASGSNLAEFSVPVSSNPFRISAAPTAADLLVDGVAANPDVLTVFPTFSWTFADLDLDGQSASEVIVTRVSTLCGGLPVCQPAPHLVWSSGKLANVNPNIVFGDGGPIIEGILPGESYTWTLRVWDDNDIPSTVYNSTFTAGMNLPATITTLTLDSQLYVPGGTPSTRWIELALNVETATPTFEWVFGGPGAQAKYQIEVSTSPTFAGGFVWQTGEVVSGATSVLYAGGALVHSTTYYARVRGFNGQNLASPFGYIKFTLNQTPNDPLAFSADGMVMNADINANVAIDVNSRTPLLTWNFSDPNLPPMSTDEQTEFVIEISTVLPFVTLFTFNSEGDPGIDGTLSSFQIPANFLKFGTVYAVRIKVKDRYGVQSTNWLQRTFETPPNTAPVISDVMVSDGNVPTDPANVLSLSPDFTWTFTDVDGHGHGFSRVVITNLNGPVVVYDTGILANASAAHTFDPGAVLGAGIAWGQNYRVDVTSWDDFSDPLNFVGPAPTYPDDVNEYDANASLLFSTPAFNLVPVSLSVVPSVINTSQQTQFDAQLSVPFAYGTFVRQNGANFTFLFSVQSDASGQIVIPSGLQPAGTHSIIVFETPIALTGGNWQLSTIGASFASAPLQVVNAGGLLGDANESGTVSALDAVFILQYVAALQTMTPTQIALGDVDGVAGANSFDAALILQFDAGIITCFPLNCPPKTAALAPDAAIAADRSTGTKDIVLTLTGNEMLSLQFTMNLHDAGLTMGDITLNSPDGWMIASNEVNGVLSVAMAGSRSVDAFDFATINTANIEDSKQLAIGMTVNNESLSAALEVAPTLPTEFALDQNFPNPFNPSTDIVFSLPVDANVVLEVYSITGQKVATLANKSFKAGQHTVRFDATRLSSGVYIYKIVAGTYAATNKMTLIK